jgi:hypothetical protein
LARHVLFTMNTLSFTKKLLFHKGFTISSRRVRTRNSEISNQVGEPDRKFSKSLCARGVDPEQRRLSNLSVKSRAAV